MNDQELRQAVGKLARDGQVACKVLLDLAEKTGTPPGRIGRLCDDMNLKIRACQLGCFR